MKRMFLALLILGITLSPALAQPTKGTPGPAGTVRVAVVNVGLVFNKYEKAQAFKKDLEDTIKPFKVKAKKLTEEMEAWNAEMQAPAFDPQLKPQYENNIRQNQKKLEDMNIEIKDLVAKNQEDNLA